MKHTPLIEAIRARSNGIVPDEVTSDIAKAHGTRGFTDEDLARLDRYDLLRMFDGLLATLVTANDTNAKLLEQRRALLGFAKQLAKECSACSGSGIALRRDLREHRCQVCKPVRKLIDEIEGPSVAVRP